VSSPTLPSGDMTSGERPGPGRVERLWVKRAHRGAMDAQTTIELVPGRGVAGSADRGGRRQVTILEREVWDALMQELGSDAGPETRRANVLVSGIDLRKSRGRVLRIGQARVRVAGEVKPCERMEESVPGLRALMFPEWRGGAFAEILEGGLVSVGDTVAWEDAPAQRT
jgi:MOSC domain-containing protein YiiM